ncbi:SH3 domain-containing protein [Streptomyces ziwulingensis]|uniref:SH3 domain-containing protein n=1 Tax=Streptomyces ziwulingensis TaxID=1045501 RepID=A0ABP9B4Z5_9ACTN
MSPRSSFIRRLVVTTAAGALAAAAAVTPAAAGDDPVAAAVTPAAASDDPGGEAPPRQSSQNSPSGQSGPTTHRGDNGGEGGSGGGGGQGSGRYRGVVTAGSLALRSAPNRGSQIIRYAHRGETVHIDCKTGGESVQGNPLWYLLTDGTWAWGAARYIDNVGPAPRWC